MEHQKGQRKEHDVRRPAVPEDDNKRYALISTCNDTYSGVPHGPTADTLSDRCEILDTRQIPDGAALDLELNG